MKNRLKKLKIFFYGSLLSAISLLFVGISHATVGTPGGGGGTVTLSNPLKVSTFSGLVSSILSAVVTIGVPIAALAIIYSGFLFVTAQGNEEKLKTAKSALVWTVVGTAILLGAWTLSQAISATIAAL